MKPQTTFPPPCLTQWQKQFRTALKGEYAELPVGVTPMFPKAVRLEVYRYAYWARQEESLEEDFPWVKGIVGEVRFAKLLRRYLRAYPSRYATLALLGRNFSCFLKQDEESQEFPFLPDVASFEWKQLVCSYSTALPRLELSQLQVDCAETLRLGLQPYVQRVTSQWSVDCAGQGPEAIQAGDFRFCIARDAENIFNLRLTLLQDRVLQAIGSGLSLDQLAKILEQLEVQPSQAGEWFQDWASRGLLARLP